jgi:hypothetical protein
MPALTVQEKITTPEIYFGVVLYKSVSFLHDPSVTGIAMPPPGEQVGCDRWLPG